MSLGWFHVWFKNVFITCWVDKNKNEKSLFYYFFNFNCVQCFKVVIGLIV